jgi:phosphomevalonate kinase
MTVQDPKQSRHIATSAPGKLMVSGEYAVLDGAVAIVASVSARVYARLSPLGSDSSASSQSRSPQTPALPQEAVLARRLAEERLGTVNASLSIDASELRRSGQKLGLGSSAAAAAAAVGAVFAHHGRDFSTPEGQREVLELALAGHKAVAPEGSGADVAAASLGGFVRFRVAGGKLAEAERVAWPAQVVTRVVWTGKEARTSEFVRSVRAFEARDGQGFGRVRDTMLGEAERFASAISAADGREILAAAHAYGQAMGALGDAAGVSIVTPELAKIAELARQHGGAAKPSGAGGGDVALAFFTREADAQAFDAACLSAGLTPLDLGLGAQGVRCETANGSAA